MCHFRFERWIDNLIVAIGQLKSNSDHAPAEPGISVKAWMDRIREYVRAINAWIDEVPLKEVISQVDTSAKVPHRVYDLLGETSPTKLWLAASLSKTMRSIGDSPFIPLDEAPPQRFKANVI